MSNNQQRETSNEVAVKVEGLTKTFKLPHEKYTSVKSVFVNFYKRKRTYELQQALKDISFEIKKGEFFGIVGRNGSGKSTLLKLMAGIYSPTRGSVTLNGSLTPFIELGVGFNPELTGRENVYLNGALLGFNHKEMKAMYEDIVEFAELEKFMDQKLKNYSSGMQVRLAFSIAIRAQGDILLLDEVLAVGDSSFQRKCLDFFKKIKKTDRTIVLVTHNMNTIQEYCDRAMMLQDSEIIGIGDPINISLQYELANSPTSVEASKNKRPRRPRVKIKKVSVRSQTGKTDQFTMDDELVVDIDLDVKKKEIIQVTLGIFNTDGDHIASINSTEDMSKFMPGVGTHNVSCMIEAGQLPKGLYKLGINVYTDSETPELIDVVNSDYGVALPAIAFIEKSPSRNGKFLIKAKWHVSK